MAKEIVVSRGVGFFPLLAVLFIGLKLTGFIAWSWWWVLAPIWIPFTVGAVLALLIVVAAAVAK